MADVDNFSGNQLLKNKADAQNYLTMFIYRLLLLFSLSVRSLSLLELPIFFSEFTILLPNYFQNRVRGVNNIFMVYLNFSTVLLVELNNPLHLPECGIKKNSCKLIYL